MKGVTSNMSVSQIEEKWIDELKIYDLELALKSSADYIFVTNFTRNEDGYYDWSGIVIKTDKYNAYKLGATIYYDKHGYLGERTDIHVVHYKDASLEDKEIKPPKKKPNPNVAGKKRLPKDLWRAINFAASMMRKGQHRVESVKIASNYYNVDFSDVMSGLAQRAGRAKRKK